MIGSVPLVMCLMNRNLFPMDFIDMVVGSTISLVKTYYVLYATTSLQKLQAVVEETIQYARYAQTKVWTVLMKMSGAVVKHLDSVSVRSVTLHVKIQNMYL
jgi:hypothetical protein